MTEEQITNLAQKIATTIQAASRANLSDLMPFDQLTDAWVAAITEEYNNPWLSVENRLPIQFTVVTVYGKRPDGTNFVGIGAMNSDHGDSWEIVGLRGFEFHEQIKVTHWMPLPKPPGQ